jgi:MurNAc alpha-1-phosphate uridylyltransferase
MKAMILAAGLGKRMSPLTDKTPKPMLLAGGQPLIHYQIERLRLAGVKEILINLAYLGEQIRDFVGTGERYGLKVDYSSEPFPLETGGAIARALDDLGAEPFILANADVWSDFDYAQLIARGLKSGEAAHLVMVPNPNFHTGGDFSVSDSGLLEFGSGEGQNCTYSGMALISPSLIAEYPEKRQKFALREVFDRAITNRQLSAQIHRGDWRDIGSPERLQELDAFLQNAV